MDSFNFFKKKKIHFVTFDFMLPKIKTYYILYIFILYNLFFIENLVTFESQTLPFGNI
jgi:hypothetical protein